MSTATPATSRELIDRVDASWRTFRDAVRRLGRARLGERPATGWTYKDMIAHVAAWMEECPGRIELVRAGRPDPIDTTPATIDAFNARAVAARRLVGPEAILDELDTAFHRVREAVASLTDEEIASGSFKTGLLSIAAWDTFLHFDEHLNELEAAGRVTRGDIAERGLDGW